MYCIGQTNKGYWSNKNIKSHSLTVVRLYKKFRQKQYSISVYRVLILCCTIVVLFSFVFGEIALIWLYLMFNASYNFRPFAMPKIIGLGANLTKLWQKLFCLVFWDTVYYSERYILCRKQLLSVILTWCLKLCSDLSAATFLRTAWTTARTMPREGLWINECMLYTVIVERFRTWRTCKSKTRLHMLVTMPDTTVWIYQETLRV